MTGRQTDAEQKSNPQVYAMAFNLKVKRNKHVNMKALPLTVKKL